MSEPGRLGLLQITLIVRDLESTLEAFAETLGLQVAFRDPSVDLWGLENAVLPMGTTFIEILSPTRENTPGGRHLDRLGGDGGYMLILQTRDLSPWRAHLARQQVRIAFEAETRDAEDGQDWSGLHLHPADTGGMMISLDQPDPPDSWAGAGPHWRDFISNDVVEGLESIAIGSPDPRRLAARWSGVLALSPPGAPLDSGRLELGAGAIDFVPMAPDGQEGLVEVRLRARARARAGERWVLGGVEFCLV